MERFSNKYQLSASYILAEIALVACAALASVLIAYIRDAIYDGYQRIKRNPRLVDKAVLETAKSTTGENDSNMTR